MRQKATDRQVSDLAQQFFNSYHPSEVPEVAEEEKVMTETELYNRNNRILKTNKSVSVDSIAKDLGYKLDKEKKTENPRMRLLREKRKVVFPFDEVEKLIMNVIGLSRTCYQIGNLWKTYPKPLNVDFAIDNTKFENCNLISRFYNQRLETYDSKTISESNLIRLVNLVHTYSIESTKNLCYIATFNESNTIKDTQPLVIVDFRSFNKVNEERKSQYISMIKGSSCCYDGEFNDWSDNFEVDFNLIKTLSLLTPNDVIINEKGSFELKNKVTNESTYNIFRDVSLLLKGKNRKLIIIGDGSSGDLATIFGIECVALGFDPTVFTINSDKKYINLLPSDITPELIKTKSDKFDDIKSKKIDSILSPLDSYFIDIISEDYIKVSEDPGKLTGIPVYITKDDKGDRNNKDKWGPLKWELKDRDRLIVRKFDDKHKRAKLLPIFSDFTQSQGVPSQVFDTQKYDTQRTTIDDTDSYNISPIRKKENKDKFNTFPSNYDIAEGNEGDSN